MSGIFTKIGAEAVESATAEKDAKSSAIASFPSGTTLKVRIKSTDAVAEYYAYGIYEKVNTFVPAQPATRNAKGFITANPTVWDRAADYYYALAKEAKERGDEAAEKKAKEMAYLFKGKPRYLVGFGSLETGEDIVVDLSKKQYNSIDATIKKYKQKLDKVAFELSKSGTSTNTVVTLTPILDMDEDLTEEERANFVKCGEKPFDFALFDDCLYIADEQEQIKNLVVAGFDIAKIGLTLGAGAQADGTDADNGDLPQF
jgi:hypothetical protein